MSSQQIDVVDGQWAAVEDDTALATLPEPHTGACQDREALACELAFLSVSNPLGTPDWQVVADKAIELCAARLPAEVWRLLTEMQEDARLGSEASLGHYADRLEAALRSTGQAAPKPCADRVGDLSALRDAVSDLREISEDMEAIKRDFPEAPKPAEPAEPRPRRHCGDLDDELHYKAEISGRWEDQPSATNNVDELRSEFRARLQPAPRELPTRKEFVDLIEKLATSETISWPEVADRVALRLGARLPERASQDDHLADVELHKLTSPAESELLALLSEECGEVVQVIGKCLRHGPLNFHPDDADQTSNRAILAKELGDVFAAVDLLSFCDETRGAVVDRASIEIWRASKLARVGRWLHHTVVPNALLHEHAAPASGEVDAAQAYARTTKELLRNDLVAAVERAELAERERDEAGAQLLQKQSEWDAQTRHYVAQIKGLEKRAQRAEDQAGKARCELDEALQQWRDATGCDTPEDAERAALGDHVDSLQMHEAWRDRDEALANLSACRKERDHWMEQATSTDAALREAARERDEARAQLASSAAQFAQMEQFNFEIQADRADLEQRLTAKSGAFDLAVQSEQRLADRIAKLETAAQEAMRKGDDHRRQRDEVRQDLAEILGQAEQAAGDLALARRERDEARAELAEWRKATGCEAALRSALRERFSVAAPQLVTMPDADVDWQATAQLSIDQLTADVKSAREERDQLRAELQATREELNDALGDAPLQQLKDDLDEAKRRIDGYQSTDRELRDKWNSELEENGRLSRELKSMHAEHQALREQHVALRAACEWTGFDGHAEPRERYAPMLRRAGFAHAGDYVERIGAVLRAATDEQPPSSGVLSEQLRSAVAQGIVQSERYETLRAASERAVGAYYRGNDGDEQDAALHDLRALLATPEAQAPATRWEDQPSATNDFETLRAEFKERLKTKDEALAQAARIAERDVYVPTQYRTEGVPASTAPLTARVERLEAALRRFLFEATLPDSKAWMETAAEALAMLDARKAQVGS